MELFWAQHIAMLLVPPLLAVQVRLSAYIALSWSHVSCFQGGPFSAPMVGELGMALLSYAVFLLYHLLILQVILVFVLFFAIVAAFISEISHISHFKSFRCLLSLSCNNCCFYLYMNLSLKPTLSHFTPSLFGQPVALLTRVNLDFVMCPAPK